MTFEEFKRITERKNSFDKYWHYFVAISIGLFFLFGIYYISFINPEKFRHVAYIVYPGMILLLIMCLSAFRLLPNRYKIIEIESPMPVIEKREITSSVVLEYCAKSPESITNYFVCYLKRRWWQSIYIMHFYYDDSRFAFSLQGHDFDGGWIDFGETERKRRKIKTEIEKLIKR